MQYTISEHKAKYDNLFKMILLIPIAIIIFTAILTYKSEPQATWVFTGIVVFIVLLFWIIIPRKFVIMQDRIKFVLGANIYFDIHFSKIMLARELKRVNFGINFSTSFREPVEIVRGKGMKINFSPINRESFIQDLDTALLNWRRASS